MKLTEYSREQLEQFKKEAEQKKEDFKALGLKLDMSRGKPSPEQLDLSMQLVSDNNGGAGVFDDDGTDLRNYSKPNGIDGLRELLAQIMEVNSRQVTIGGCSSLNLMFDAVAQGITTGFGEGSWVRDGKIKFLCPAPGYDRHFGICEYFDIEMIPVDMKEDGPDMDAIEKLVANDKQIKGMWVVPKYSNPTGVIFSDEVVERLASLKPAAKDFRIFWDNAYAVHHLYSENNVKSIFKTAKKHNNEDIVLMFTSTSKITFSGGGVSAIAASDFNMDLIRKRMNAQIICGDRLKQLAHLKLLKNIDGVKEQMKKHAAIIRPKFDAVFKAFDENLDGLGIAKWSHPQGGYFISFDTMDGCAKRVVELCKEMGVTFTPAGSTWPYGKDPHDCNIRIAPTMPPVEEVEKAAEILCTAVKLASAEKLLEA